MIFIKNTMYAEKGFYIDPNHVVSIESGDYNGFYWITMTNGQTFGCTEEDKEKIIEYKYNVN